MHTNSVIAEQEAMATVEIKNVRELDESKTDTGKMVVVIDQNAADRGHLRELVELEGFIPSTFTDAYQMVRHIEENSANIKVAFIDFSIFSTIEKTLLSIISHLKSKIRLVITNAEIPREKISGLVGKGVYGFVKKPYCEGEIAAFLH